MYGAADPQTDDYSFRMLRIGSNIDASISPETHGPSRIPDLDLTFLRKGEERHSIRQCYSDSLASASVMYANNSAQLLSKQPK